jgi:hypothetical protein
MKETLSERRLAENEVVFRQLNEQVKKGVEETNKLAIEENQHDMIIDLEDWQTSLQFYCECSDENCTKRVTVDYAEYNKIHEQRDHFIVAPGHEVAKIEQVVRKEDGFVVVKKYGKPPETVDVLHQTNIDNS